VLKEDRELSYGAFIPCLLAISLVAVAARQAGVADVLPRPESPCERRIGLTADASIPCWPGSVESPEDAPNIVLILLDDVGFGDASTFGGVARTPEMDRLAAQGLRYNNFHTASLCSPTRAALLTGRNHHQVGFGRIPEMADGFPGYDSVWKENAASIAAVLRGYGYSTAAIGKWHNTPVWEISPAGPFDRWPTGLGFEYFYGFMGGEDSHWEPALLYRGITAVEADARSEQGYHLTTDLTDDAIQWVRTHDSLTPERPYFLYFATGATHSPHHVPNEWIDPYRGRFDQGWDELREETFARQKELGVIPADARLTERPEGLPAWDSLSADHKRLFARQMEVYAGYIAHTDHEVGRLLKAVQQGPRGDNTLILYIVGDNGASGMGGLEGTDADLPVSARLQRIDELGGPLHMNMYAAGWAWSAGSPFQGVKGIASHFGGLRNPLIVAWPGRIKDQGGLRSQFTHVNDVAATLYEAAGIRMPEVVGGVRQLPLEGVSFRPSFDDPEAAEGHRVQYFEMWGNRAIYVDGWVAAARHDAAWNAGGWANAGAAAHPEASGDRWELFDVSRDFSQAHDLAAQHPEKLKELQQRFDAEARRNNVYPLATSRDFEKTFDAVPSIARGRREFTFHAGTPRVPVWSGPDIGRSPSYRITAEVRVPDGGARGVILAWGGRFEGLVLYIENDHLVFENNSGRTRESIRSNIPMPEGASVITYEYVPDDARQKRTSWYGRRPGTGRLYIDGRTVGSARVTQSTYYFGSIGIGRGSGSPVSAALDVPSAFTGTIDKVTVTL